MKKVNKKSNELNRIKRQLADAQQALAQANATIGKERKETEGTWEEINKKDNELRDLRAYKEGIEKLVKAVGGQTPSFPLPFMLPHPYRF